MRTVDLRVEQAIRLIQRLLDFFETRLNETRPLICKDICFQTFSRFEKLSKLLHDFRKKQSNVSNSFCQAPSLLAIQESLEHTFLDAQLLSDLLASIDNAWPYLENTFCENIDVTDVKKEITIKLKCQTHSEFSTDREDLAVLALILVEEFCRYVDAMAECLRVIFLNDKTVDELAQAHSFEACRGFRRFFEFERGSTLMTDFYQKLNRYVSTLTENLEANVRAMKVFRARNQEDSLFSGPMLITNKQTIYKEFVQKKLTGLISLIQKKSAMGPKTGADGLDEMTSDFLSNIVNEVSVQHFEDHLKELGSLAKVG